MKKLWIPILIIIVIVVGVLIYSSQRSAEPQEKGMIKIGAILPLTGDIADIGQDQKNAVNLAIEEFKDLDIRLTFEDDQLLADKAVTAAQKLINVDKVDALVGPSWSAAALAVAPIAEQNKVTLISPSASTPSLTPAGDYIFRVFPADDELVKRMAEFTFGNLNIKKAAVFYGSANDSFVQERNYVKDEFGELGGKIVIEEAFKTGDKDFRTQLLKIKNSEAEAIFFSAFPAETGIFLKQIRELDINLPLLSLDSVVENKDVLETAQEASEGVIYLVPQKPDNKEYTEFVSVYKEKYGKEPAPYTLEAYDAVKLIIKAIISSDGTKKDIKDKLYQVGQNYTGASGEITFDENGDVHKDYILKTIKNGQFVLYE